MAKKIYQSPRESLNYGQKLLKVLKVLERKPKLWPKRFMTT